MFTYKAEKWIRDWAVIAYKDGVECEKFIGGIESEAKARDLEAVLNEVYEYGIEEGERRAKEAHGQ